MCVYLNIYCKTFVSKVKGEFGVVHELVCGRFQSIRFADECACGMCLPVCVCVFCMFNPISWLHCLSSFSYIPGRIFVHHIEYCLESIIRIFVVVKLCHLLVALYAPQCHRARGCINLQKGSFAKYTISRGNVYLNLSHSQDFCAIVV